MENPPASMTDRIQTDGGDEELKQLVENWSKHGHRDARECEEYLTKKLNALVERNTLSFFEINDRIKQVVSQLTQAEDALETFEMWLVTCTQNIAARRSDNEALEQQNNRLEQETKNKSELISVLDDLLQSLELPQHAAACLANPELDGQGLSRTIEAAKVLQRVLQSPLGALESIRAVQEKRGEHHHLRAVFGDKVARELSLRFHSLSKELRLTRKGSGEKLSDHSRVYDALTPLSPILACVRALSPDTFALIHKRYSEEMHKVFAREFHDFFIDAKSRVLRASRPLGSLAKINLADSRMPPSDEAPNLEGSANPFRPAVEELSCVLSEFAAHVRGEQYFLLEFLFQRDSSVDDALQGILAATLGDLSPLTSIVSAVVETNRCLFLPLEALISVFMRQWQNNSPFLIGVSAPVKMYIKRIHDSFVADHLPPLDDAPSVLARRTGLLPSFAKFPHLCAQIEAALDSIRNPNIRSTRLFVNTEVYPRLCKRLFEALNHECSQREARHACILRLENTHHFALSAGRLATLGTYVNDAEHIFQTESGSFVRELLRDHFSKLLDYFYQLEAHLQVVANPQDVQLQHPFDQPTFRKLKKWFSENMKRGLKEILRHITKQLASRKLIDMLWRSAQEAFASRVAHFADLSRRCFSEDLMRSQDELDELYRAIDAKHAWAS
eukprot:gnl/Trimastix_PCT/4189.p1 GENE.gnl/Trimastix_PCT/4189~~gnl/Trimastix_PCT/4189.p1  ORF type:complete len:673 (-),score=109.30 gnl/Trimastix_PCT/4189:34-2052(-)